MLALRLPSLYQRPAVPSRVRFHSSIPQLSRPKYVVRAAEAGTLPQPAVEPQPAITLTDNALEQLKKLRAEAGGEDLLLRVGIKNGGCSGMSYRMDFEKPSNVTEDDHVMEFRDGFRLAIDPKSLLFLFGMRMDYSSALIGGGFQFHNPNATESCGCGKSFGV